MNAAQAADVLGVSARQVYALAAPGRHRPISAMLQPAPPVSTDTTCKP